MASPFSIVLGVLFCSQLFAGAAEETNAPAAPSPAPATNAPPSAAASPSQEFQAFRIIAQRNIFNPNRRPELTQRPPRAVRTEAFSLVGTLLDEGGIGALAWFDGTGPQYKKVLKPGEQIAGYKVCEVASDSVKLEADEDKIDLPMGMQMKRQEEEKWQLVLGTAVSTGSSSSPPPPSVTSSPNSSFGNRERGSDFGRRDRGSDFGGRNRGSDFGGRTRGSDFGRRDRTSEAGQRERISISTSSTDAGFELKADVVADAVADAATEGAAVAEGGQTSDGGASSGSGADDILRKLMQRRQQESNQ